MGGKVKKRRIEVNEYTTSDGKVFIGEKAAKNAKQHQIKLNLLDQEKNLKRAIWIAFGFDKDLYDEEYCPGDPDGGEENVIATDRMMNELFDTFGYDLVGEKPETFGEFMEAVHEIFVDHYSDCAKVMMIINHYIKK